FDQTRRTIEHQPFGDSGVVPLAAGENLLEAIEVLEACKCGLFGQPQPTYTHRHTLAVTRVGGEFTGKELQQPRRVGMGRNSIAALVTLPRDNDFHYAAAVIVEHCRYLAIERRAVDAHAEAFAPARESSQMATQQRRAMVLHPD